MKWQDNKHVIISVISKYDRNTRLRNKKFLLDAKLASAELYGAGLFTLLYFARHKIFKSASCYHSNAQRNKTSFIEQYACGILFILTLGFITYNVVVTQIVPALSNSVYMSCFCLMFTLSARISLFFFARMGIFITNTS